MSKNTDAELNTVTFTYRPSYEQMRASAPPRNGYEFLPFSERYEPSTDTYVVVYLTAKLNA